MKKSKLLGCLGAVIFCVMSFSSVVHAGCGEEEEVTPTITPMKLETPKPVQETTPEAEQTEESLVTRDLLYDKETNKQFLSIETRNGKVFYLVIDYDKPVDEKGEKYETYFLNLVDEEDLLDLIEENPESTPVVCTCTERCELGAVNTECPLCMQDIKSCAGEEKETEEPEKTKEPSVTVNPVKKEGSGNNTALLGVVLLLALAGGGLAFYFKKIKGNSKVKVPSELEEYDFEEEEYEVEEEEVSDEEGEE